MAPRRSPCGDFNCFDSLAAAAAVFSGYRRLPETPPPPAADPAASSPRDASPLHGFFVDAGDLRANSNPRFVPCDGYQSCGPVVSLDSIEGSGPWSLLDCRHGRLLLRRGGSSGKLELSVCDPASQRFQFLPSFRPEQRIASFGGAKLIASPRGDEGWLYSQVICTFGGPYVYAHRAGDAGWIKLPDSTSFGVPPPPSSSICCWLKSKVVHSSVQLLAVDVGAGEIHTVRVQLPLAGNAVSKVKMMQAMELEDESAICVVSLSEPPAKLHCWRLKKSGEWALWKLIKLREVEGLQELLLPRRKTYGLSIVDTSSGIVFLKKDHSPSVYGVRVETKQAFVLPPAPFTVASVFSFSSPGLHNQQGEDNAGSWSGSKGYGKDRHKLVGSKEMMQMESWYHLLL